MIVVCSTIDTSIAIDISDTFNGLMAIPNLIGVLVLSPIVVKITKNYLQRHIKGESVPPILSADAKIQAQFEADLDD